MKSINEITDEALIQHCSNLAAKNGVLEKLDYITSITSPSFIGNLTTRTINNITYVWGYQPNSNQTASMVADWFQEILATSKLKEMELDLNKRMQLAQTGERQKILLREELRAVLNDVANDAYIKVGYQAQARLKQASKVHAFSENNSNEDYQKVAIGSANFQYEQLIKEKLQMMEAEDDMHFEDIKGIPVDSPKFQICFEHYWDKFKKLRPNYLQMLPTSKLVNLYRFRTRINDKESLSTYFREINRYKKELSTSGRNDKGIKKDNKALITERVKKKLAQAFWEIGLSQEDLDELGLD